MISSTTSGREDEMGGIYWLASYPKSGNTWFRIWLRHLRAADPIQVDFEALDTPIASSRAWLDSVLGYDTADLSFNEVDRLRPVIYDWSRTRDPIAYHKIHDACHNVAGDMPITGFAALGAVYIVRNPLDVAPSYAAHSGRTIDQTIDYMADTAHGHSAHTDRLATQVRQHYSNWSTHVHSWMSITRYPVHLVRYEDMHADPVATLVKAAQFLRIDHDPVRIVHAIGESSFERLQAQERAVGFAERPPYMDAFFRRGRAGGWRTQLTDAQVARVVADHGEAMRAIGYLDEWGNPV